MRSIPPAPQEGDTPVYKVELAYLSLFELVKSKETLKLSQRLKIKQRIDKNSRCPVFTFNLLNVVYSKQTGYTNADRI